MGTEGFLFVVLVGCLVVVYRAAVEYLCFGGVFIPEAGALCPFCEHCSIMPLLGGGLSSRQIRQLTVGSCV